MNIVLLFELKFMPHISSKKIEDKYFQKIYDQLISVFDSAGSKRKSGLFLKEILTDTEKIMFTKRLGIICMLSENVSKTYISEILLVSPSTINKISLKYEIGKYPYIRNILEKNARTMWQIFEQMVHDSVSKKIGKKRLSWLNEIDRKYERKLLKT